MAASCLCPGGVPDLLHVQHDGDLICRNCGLVLEGMLMCDGPETRFFAEDGGPDPCRVGLPVDHLLPNASMGTVIGGKGRQAARIRLLNLSQRVPSKERCLLRTFKVMTRLGLHTLGLPEAAVALSKQMFSDMRERGIKQGAIFRATPACCVYFAGKASGMHRPRAMVCEAFGLAATDFTKGYKHMLDNSIGLPYYHALIADVDPTRLTSIMLNTLVDLIPAQHHAVLRCTVHQVHSLVREYCPSLLGHSEVTLIAAEVMAACAMHGIACPEQAVANAVAVRPTTLAKYVQHVVACCVEEAG